jgi:NAD-specific glutamate dehydrogenase
MSGRAQTDDVIGVKQPRPSGVSREKRAWIGKVLGIDLESLLALDLRTSTTQSSADNAVPVLLKQVTEIVAPLKTVPHAETPALATALQAIQTIRTGLSQKPDPQAIVGLRQQVEKLADLIGSAVNSVTQLQQRQQAAIDKAKELKYSEDARDEHEGELIKSFQVQQAGVAKAFESGPLAATQAGTAEESLNQATETAAAIDNAVEQRHAAWAKRIREAADGLMKGFTDKQVDPALWVKPKTTREAIDKELVSS